MSHEPRRLGPSTVLSWLIVAGYLAIALVQIGDSLIIDEIEFPRLAESIAETGRPVYYRGEQSPALSGTFHPPLYGYALGGWIALLGFSEEAVRLFGVLMMLGTAHVGVRIVEHWNLAGQWGRPAFLALFLLHPFVIQSALLPDIDGTVLLFATVLVLLVATKIPTRDDWKESALRLGSVFALALATKLTAALLIPTVLLGLAIAVGLRKALQVVGAAFLVGSGIFFGAWWALATVTDLSFAYPFEFFVESGLKGGVTDTTWGELFGRLIPGQPSIFWVGVFLPVGALIGTCVIFARWRARPIQRPALMYAVWSLGILMFYSLITGPPFGFPKYLIAALPTLAILSVFVVDAIAERVQARPVAPWLFVTAAIALATTWAWRFSIASGVGRYGWPGPGWLIPLLGISWVVALLLVRPASGRLRGSLVMAWLIAAISTGLGMSVAQSVDRASVRYFPGEVGFDETVERLKTLTSPSEVMLLPKDIGSATYNRYHEQEQLFRNHARLALVLDDPSVTYAVVRVDWDYSYKVFPEVEPLIEEKMDLLEIVGDFMIYVRTAD